MSYNIDSIEVIYSKDFAVGANFDAAEDENQTPEISVFDDDWNIEKGFWWNGEFSGSTFSQLKRVLATFDGEADLVLTWEGGDSFTGLRLRDHVVTQHVVEFALGEVSQ